MKKRTLIWVVLSLVLIAGTIIVAVRYWLYSPDYPEEVLYDRITYAIDPQSIITSLDRGETDVYKPAPPEPEGEWPILWPPGSFVWDQEDYLEVADALHQFVWNQNLGNWDLIRASFNIDQCQDILGKIDSASLSFFQRQNDSNTVHGFWINPISGIITAGNQYSERSDWTVNWETIDLSKIKVNSVDAALLIAEANGGENTRLLTRNQCRIRVLLAPDRFENSFLSHPFKRYSWGWSIIYWPIESNADPFFSIIIDPYTGKFEILN